MGQIASGSDNLTINKNADALTDSCATVRNTHDVEAVGRGVIDSHSEVVPLQQKGKRILVAMIAPALFSQTDEGDFAVPRDFGQNSQRTSVHT